MAEKWTKTGGNFFTSNINAGVASVRLVKSDGGVTGAFNADFKEGGTYRQTFSDGSVRDFTIKAGTYVPMPSDWERRGDIYYYKGVAWSDWGNAYNYAPSAYSVTGSRYYADGLPGGLTGMTGLWPSSWNYPGRYSKGTANDVLGIDWSSDGRLWAGMLVNVSGNVGQSQMLFYSDDNGVTWAQYAPIVSYNSWTGGFIILKSDMTVSGYDFKRGEVISCALSQSGTGQPQGETWVWKSPSIYHFPADKFGTVIGKYVAGRGLDPHPIISGGSLRVINNIGRGNVSAYTHTRFTKLVNGGASTQDAATQVMPYKGNPDPANLSENFEVGAPFIGSDGLNYMFFSAQGLNADTSKGWNSIQNGVFFTRLDSNFGGAIFDLKSQLVDVGHDYYAQAVGRDSNGRLVLLGTLMNWALSARDKYRYNTSTEIRRFTIEGGGNLRFDKDGFVSTGRREGNVWCGATRLYYINGSGVGNVNTVGTTWGADWINYSYTHWPDLGMDIRNIWLRDNGEFGVLIIEGGSRDWLLNLYCATTDRGFTLV